MTFKNNNKSTHPIRKLFSKRGQAIFEYFILTIVVAAMVLFFASTGFFSRQDPEDAPGIKEKCEEAFNQAMEEILE